jgi:glucosamine-6-phosphate deaminase
MNIKISNTSESLATTAAFDAAAIIRDAVAQHGTARIIAATGASQLTFLEKLTAIHNVPWEKVEMFHLDEYVDLPEGHPASFCEYLIKRLLIPTGIHRYHLLNGNIDPQAICDRVGKELSRGPIHVAFVGIGENGHLAFNDPPANFEAVQPYLIVNLDEDCRRQQVGEGWFPDVSKVPAQAITMSIRQILRAEKILCIVPDARKAQATQICLEGEITPRAPASILRSHQDITLYLDKNSAALLGRNLAAGISRVADQE